MREVMTSDEKKKEADRDTDTTQVRLSLRRDPR